MGVLVTAMPQNALTRTKMDPMNAFVKEILVVHNVKNVVQVITNTSGNKAP